MNATISQTAYQTGFGTDQYKHVSGLTPTERDSARLGGIVLFQSRLSGGKHGTPWRYALDCGSYGFAPRVATPEMVAAAGGKWKWTGSNDPATTATTSSTLQRERDEANERLERSHDDWRPARPNQNETETMSNDRNRGFNPDRSSS